MSKEPRDPRLFVKPNPPKRVATTEEVRDLLNELARRSREATPQANIGRCREYAKKILEENIANSEAKEFAQSVLENLATVDALIKRGASIDAINAGMLLGAKFEAMRLSRIFAEGVDGARRIRSGGRKGGTAKHQAAQAAVDKKWRQLESKAQNMNAAGQDRASILEVLGSEGAKRGVKRSTIEKNSRIRRHLPAARRKSSP